MKGYQDAWLQKTHARQMKLFSLQDDQPPSDEISSDSLMNSLSELVQVNEEDCGVLEARITQFADEFVRCHDVSAEPLMQLNFDKYLLNHLENSETPQTLNSVLMILISWVNRWPGHSGFMLTNDAGVLVANLVFTEGINPRSLYLSLNLLSRIIIASPSIKDYLTSKHQIVKHLVNAFLSCEETKIRDLILLCLWSILHSSPHPSFSQIADMPKLFANIFTDPDAPNFEKRLYLASVFAECDETCAFIICEILPVSEALQLIPELSSENQESFLNLLVAILDANDSCSSMSVIGGMSWEFFGFIASLENEELIIAAIRLVCAVFRNAECSCDITIMACESQVFDILFEWSDKASYQIRRWSAIALMQAFANKTDEVFQYFVFQNNMFERMSNYLDLNSNIVTREILSAIPVISGFCATQFSNVSALMDELGIIQTSEEILAHIESSDPFLQTSTQLIEEVQEKLIQIHEEIQS